MAVEPRALILTVAFRHVINEPNIEAGFAKFVALTDRTITYDAFYDAIAECIRDGLIRVQTVRYTLTPK